MGHDMSVLEQIHQEHNARQARLGVFPPTRIKPIPAIANAPEPVPVAEPAPIPQEPEAPKPDPIWLPRTEWRLILIETAEKHGVTVAQIVGETRVRNVANARHEAAFRMATEADMSLPAIGRRLGHRDHTTALHSIRKFIESNPEAAGVAKYATERRMAEKKRLRRQVMQMLREGHQPTAIYHTLPVSEGFVWQVSSSMGRRAHA